MVMKDWTFAQFLDEIIYLSEILEVPGIKEARLALIAEMWKRFPVSCRAVGLSDGGVA